MADVFAMLRPTSFYKVRVFHLSQLTLIGMSHEMLRPLTLSVCTLPVSPSGNSIASTHKIVGLSPLKRVAIEGIGIR